MSTSRTGLDPDDRRHKIRDDEGNEWYVTSTAVDGRIAGPFGSHEYACTVRDRLDPKWPGTAYVEVEVGEQHN